MNTFSESVHLAPSPGQGSNEVVFSEYRNKHVVVTGASSGIGEAVARTLTELGAQVHAFSRRRPAFEVDTFTHLDLSDPDSVLAAAEGIEGRIDSLFNCAGAVPMAPSL